MYVNEISPKWQAIIIQFLMQVSLWWQVACRTDTVGKTFQSASRSLPEAFPFPKPSICPGPNQNAAKSHKSIFDTDYVVLMFRQGVINDRKLVVLWQQLTLELSFYQTLGII